MYDKVTLVNTFLYVIAATLYFSTAFIKQWFIGDVTTVHGLQFTYTYGLLSFCNKATGQCYDYDDIPEADNNWGIIVMDVTFYVLLIGGSFISLSVIMSFFKTSVVKQKPNPKIFIYVSMLANMACAIALGCGVAIAWRIIRMVSTTVIDPKNGSTVHITYGVGYYMAWLSVVMCLVAVVLNSRELRVWRLERNAVNGNSLESPSNIPYTDMKSTK